MAKTRVKEIKNAKAAARASADVLLLEDKPQPGSSLPNAGIARHQALGGKVKKKRPRVSLSKMKAGRKAKLGHTK